MSPFFRTTDQVDKIAIDQNANHDSNAIRDKLKLVTCQSSASV